MLRLELSLQKEAAVWGMVRQREMYHELKNELQKSVRFFCFVYIASLCGLDDSETGENRLGKQKLYN